MNIHFTADKVIWSQCVHCTDFTPEVRTKILEAAGRGVRFQMVINKHSPAAEEFRGLFDPIEGAEIIETPDNAISMQGMSDREAVIAFPRVEWYTPRWCGTSTSWELSGAGLIGMQRNTISQFLDLTVSLPTDFRVRYSPKTACN